MIQAALRVVNLSKGSEVEDVRETGLSEKAGPTPGARGRYLCA